MSSRTIALAVLTASALGVFPWVWENSGAELPRPISWVLLVANCVVIATVGLLVISSRVRSLRNGLKRSMLMALALTSLYGAFIGAIVAPVVWALIPAEKAGEASDNSPATGEPPEVKSVQTEVSASAAQESQPSPPPKERSIQDVTGHIGPKDGLRIDGIPFGGGVWMGNTLTIVTRWPHTAIAENSSVAQYEPILRLEEGPKGVLLSAKCFDKDGDVLLVIEKNEFIRNVNNTFRIGGK